MGIGNLRAVLDLYDGGRAVPYPQLYFDTAPDHHPAAYRPDLELRRRLLAVLLAAARRPADHAPVPDRPELLQRLIALQTGTDSNAYVLHPPDRGRAFANPDALDRATRRGSPAAALQPRRGSACATTPGSGRSRRGSASRRRSTAACARPRSTC